MDRKRNWRAIFTWLLLTFSILYVLPSVVTMPSWYPFTKTVRGGLDLEGGLELRYQVVWQKAVEDVVAKAADGLRSRVAEELAKADNKNWADLSAEEREPYLARITYEPVDMNVGRITFADQTAYDLVDDDMLVQVDERVALSQASGLAYDLILPDDQWVDIRTRIVTETRDGIEKRVEGMGMLDPDVRVAGESDISVQIPGLSGDEMDLVRQHLGRPAQLRFRAVDRKTPFLDASMVAEFKAAFPEQAPSLEFEPSSATGPFAKAKTKTELVRFVRWLKNERDVPDQRMFGFQREELRDRDNALTDSFWRTQYLESQIWLTGNELVRAQPTMNERNQPAVSLNLNSDGTTILADVSERLSATQEHFAIMLDDDVISDPYFKEKIPSGRAEISMGSGTRSQGLREARALSDVLNNGAYQAPVYKVADNEVGPSLGNDQVSAGSTALLLGFALVVAFMIVYYRGAGVIAVVVLLFNVLLITTLLISFNSALTLPGIAGIILTIGMAVDANIIIFERIREELVAGRTPRAAVDTGYGKALSAILDSNITTGLAGLILLNYTSGTIRNFAVTLLVGIVCSVFTAVVVARMLFNYWLAKKKPVELSI